MNANKSEYVAKCAIILKVHINVLVHLDIYYYQMADVILNQV